MSSAGAVAGADVHRLTSYLETRRPGLVNGELSIELVPGGRSNLTYVVADGCSSWVLRRPPLGRVLETAHDMHREVRVLRALAGTAVPVPEIVIECDSPEVIGAPFFLMQRVHGLILRTEADFNALSVERGHAIANSFIDILAELHRIDSAAVGLQDFGRPEGYLSRQVLRWRKQRAGSWVRDLPGFEDLSSRLEQIVPGASAAAIIHGDYRLDNTIVDPDSATICAVLDWEMATFGDPLADLGMVYLFWRGWAGMDNPIAGTPGEHQAFPSWTDLVARYTARVGHEVDNLRWYASFAFYKMAVILEGIYCRHLEGHSSGERFAAIGQMVPLLIERGLQTLDSSAELT